MSEKFNWGNAENLRGINDDIEGDYLKTDFGFSQIKNDPYFFVVTPDHNKSYIVFYEDTSDINDYKPVFITTLNASIDTAKKIVENTIKHFTGLEEFKLKDIEDHIKQRNKEYFMSDENESPEPVSDRQLETAQKTGYVQGVCESVLAFNNDENRKIMTEATMTFLSKKLLSEMNVTKDMAQKFANPETYKALEQSVFAPKQEQHLEQTQSQRRGI
jgi:hypothetical protein